MGRKKFKIKRVAAELLPREMTKIERQLKKFKPGEWIKVYWPDPSADPVEDGSASELIDKNKPIKYGTLGHFVGIDNKTRTLILANDQREDKNEFRGTLNIPVQLIYKIKTPPGIKGTG